MFKGLGPFEVFSRDVSGSVQPFLRLFLNGFLREFELSLKDVYGIVQGF